MRRQRTKYWSWNSCAMRMWAEIEGLIDAPRFDLAGIGATSCYVCECEFNLSLCAAGGIPVD